jgi:hypothetical protein
MRVLDRYTVEAARDDERRVLVRRDEPGASVPVDGIVLEAQFALPDGGALVWLTDDSPYEEGLHVYLLGPDDRVHDAVEAGAAWAAGILAIRATGDTWAEFEFFRTGSVYRLVVEPTSRMRLRLPQGWKYKTLLGGHRLVVRQLSGGG